MAKAELPGSALRKTLLWDSDASVRASGRSVASSAAPGGRSEAPSGARERSYAYHSRTRCPYCSWCPYHKRTSCSGARTAIVASELGNAADGVELCQLYSRSTDEAVLIRSDGSALVRWPSGSIAVSVDPDGLGSPHFRFLAMNERGMVVASFDGRGSSTLNHNDGKAFLSVSSLWTSGASPHARQSALATCNGRPARCRLSQLSQRG
jgi:hypothetical protein